MSVNETPNKDHSTIDYLIANFNAPQMSNLYHVAFHLPSSLGQDIIWDGVRASAVTIPGRGLKVEDYANNLTKTKKIVNGFEDPSDNGVNISFYCDTNWTDRRIIQAWMDYIVDQDTAFDGNDELRQVTPSLRYYKEYTGKIEIKTLRRFNSRLQGHPDKKKLKILDFKQSNKPKRREYSVINEYGLQLALYSIAHDSMFGTQISSTEILMCTPNLIFQNFEFKGQEFENLKMEAMNRVEQYYNQKNLSSSL